MVLATVTVLAAWPAAFAQAQNHDFAFHLFAFTTANENVSLRSVPDSFHATRSKPASLVAEEFNAYDNYPKPDFSVMEKYYEIVKYTYDFQSSPRMFLVVKMKVEDAPGTLSWGIKWLDEDGVIILDSTIMDFANHSHYDVGEPIRVSARAPTERQMANAKSIVVYRILRG